MIPCLMCATVIQCLLFYIAVQTKLFPTLTSRSDVFNLLVFIPLMCKRLLLVHAKQTFLIFKYNQRISEMRTYTDLFSIQYLSFKQTI